MRKIVYNTCFGGASLSDKAIERYAELKGITYFSCRDILADRTDPVLIQVIEELGEEANGNSADLQITELPAGTQYHIHEYDGNERIMTPDDYNWVIA